MPAATEYSLTNPRSFARADSTLSRANLATPEFGSPGGRDGTTRVSINLTSNPPTRRTVLQIKPACTPLIEQNFDTGLTRNSPPRVTKHRVNTIVLSRPPPPILSLHGTPYSMVLQFQRRRSYAFWIRIVDPCYSIKSIWKFSVSFPLLKLDTFFFKMQKFRTEQSNPVFQQRVNSSIRIIVQSFCSFWNGRVKDYQLN